MCEFCNPLGLAQPAATQAHGTIFLAIGVVVVVMAIVGRLVLTGIGPFEASIAGVAPSATGLSVTISITNSGSRAGASTCRIDDASSATGASTIFLSPQVQPGTTETFTRDTDAFGTSVRTLSVTCGAP